MSIDTITRAELGDPTSSFSQFLRLTSPELLPGAALAHGDAHLSPTATTIVAVATPTGVVLAGDRRATMGSMIAQRDIQKVYTADDFSAIGIAGSAGLAIDLVKLFRVELEHYEKIEGAPLTLDGKANRLASMIRSNLGMALQGFIVIPLFVGWDLQCDRARIFSYDATGGCYEETGYHAVGSGSVFAKGSLKKLYSPKASLDRAVEMCVQALFDAADDDSATGGPDVARQIYPVVITVGPDGATQVPEKQIAVTTDRVLAARAVRPDGPEATL
ncbi:MAG: proteasome subunit beta [Propionibacteriaceae bacterium]|jgi:proteasome beta subunit|nr:proteasome subunit beta [Propionibacteriaceae bacterium]